MVITFYEGLFYILNKFFLGVGDKSTLNYLFLIIILINAQNY